MHWKALPAALLGAGLLISAASAHAQEASTEDEIIVTALKRRQFLQNVPASIIILSADVTRRFAAKDFSQVADVVPGVA